MRPRVQPAAVGTDCNRVHLVLGHAKPVPRRALIDRVVQAGFRCGERPVLLKRTDVKRHSRVKYPFDVVETTTLRAIDAVLRPDQ